MIARMPLARAACLALLGLPLPAQEPESQPTPERLLEHKLASPFLKNAKWTLDWDEARAEAKRTGRLIFAYLTTAAH
jgi:hypothetical protein